MNTQNTPNKQPNREQSNKDIKQLQDSKFALPLVPIIFFFFLANQLPAIMYLLLIVIVVPHFVRIKQANARLDKSGISTEERNALIAEYNKKHKAKNILAIAVLVLCLIMSSSLGSCGRSSSRKSSSSQPWKELGVSKSQYMEIYNKYKYGG